MNNNKNTLEKRKKQRENTEEKATNEKKKNIGPSHAMAATSDDSIEHERTLASSARALERTESFQRTRHEASETRSWIEGQFRLATVRAFIIM